MRQESGEKRGSVANVVSRATTVALLILFSKRPISDKIFPHLLGVVVAVITVAYTTTIVLNPKYTLIGMFLSMMFYITSAIYIYRRTPDVMADRIVGDKYRYTDKHQTILEILVEAAIEW